MNRSNALRNSATWRWTQAGCFFVAMGVLSLRGVAADPKPSTKPAPGKAPVAAASAPQKTAPAAAPVKPAPASAPVKAAPAANPALPATSAASTGTVNPAVQAAGSLYQGIIAETLPNGLRVFMKPIEGSPVVTTMVAYRVGSADEELQHTGLSHYLEHLMFKGTEKIKPGDIDKSTLRNGGANNAYTSEDFTIFHFDFAADRWEQALEIEADRMQNLRIDEKHEFEQEKGAVIEELQRDEDQPWDLENKTILPLLFGEQNPYGHPVIGLREHVRGSTAKVIKSHYDLWYHPNNAALVICGGFDAEKAMDKVKSLFGPIPKVELQARKSAKPVHHEKPIHAEFESKFELARMLMGFNAMSRTDPDFYAMEVLDAILSGGKTGRLYKRLIEQNPLASEVGTSISCGRYPGWFAVQLELLKGVDRAKAEDMVLEELAKVSAEPVSATELQRVKQMLLTSDVFKREGVHDLADSIAQGVTLADLNLLREHLPKVMAVTAADVQRVAKKYLELNSRVVVWSVPKGDEGVAPPVAPGAPEPPVKAAAPEVAPGKGGGKLSPTANRSSLTKKRASREAAPGAGGGAFSLKDVKRADLPNGLTVLLLENHRLPIVTAVASVRHPSFYETAEQNGLSNLTGQLLDEGTSKHTSSQIAEMIEDVGGTLAMGGSGGSVAVLSPHRQLGIGLLLECLTDAKFSEPEFLRQKNRLLSQIDDNENQPDNKAREIFRESIYGAHPFGRRSLGDRKSVEKLTTTDCKKFFTRVFVPNNTVLAVVGDFDSAKLLAEIREMTANWKKTPLDEPKLPEVKPKDKPEDWIISMPEAAQCHILMGHVGIRRDNPDFYKLLVMDYILGTGPGFTDRLSSRVRDREGLAYTVTANVSSSAGEEPGLFMTYIGSDAKNFKHVREVVMEEINRIRDTSATKEEVEDVKSYLVGNLPFHFNTSPLMAAQMLYVDRYHLGVNYFDDYRQAVNAVTVADVQEVAKKYLHPKHLVTVAVGAIDKDGRVLPPPKAE